MWSTFFILKYQFLADLKVKLEQKIPEILGQIHQIKMINCFQDWFKIGGRMLKEAKAPFFQRNLTMSLILALIFVGAGYVYWANHINLVGKTYTIRHLENGKGTGVALKFHKNNQVSYTADTGYENITGVHGTYQNNQHLLQLTSSKNNSKSIKFSNLQKLTNGNILAKTKYQGETEKVLLVLEK